MSSAIFVTHQDPPTQVCRYFQQTGTCLYGAQCKFAHVQQMNAPTAAPPKKEPGRKRRPRSRKKPTQSDSRSYIRAFFDKYTLFDYSPSEPVMSEFYRMCDMYRWDREDETKKQARLDLKDALTLQFNAIYGEDENSLEAWQNLCVVLNIGNIPTGLDACRKLVRSMFVNIVDLIDTPVTQEPVVHFETEEALSVYTKSTGKFFPAENAYAGGLLRFLLRQIMVPGKSTSSRRQAKK
ncbi:hypothetical protein BDV93DRAFT_498096 [Ceratobasidium sp. AG-I]|nr:hypothetical protein BDV93DRAFT_498096 [Ceratobasidium sp. AG-I]